VTLNDPPSTPVSIIAVPLADDVLHAFERLHRRHPAAVALHVAVDALPIGARRPDRRVRFFQKRKLSRGFDRGEGVAVIGRPVKPLHPGERDVRALLEAATLDAGVRTRALATFARLAEAEAVVHGSPVDDVHFHEVGALDAIVDVVGACAGLEHLALDVLVVSPVAVGGGHVGTEHGRLPVPAPAVAELLRGLPSYGGPVDLELCTPTGAALLVANATGTGGQPAMTTTAIGLGAGGHDPAGHTNALRLLVGVSTGSTTADRSTTGDPLLLETNVDDLDPRLWPAAITALLAAGASDAWCSIGRSSTSRPQRQGCARTPRRWSRARRSRTAGSRGCRFTARCGARRSSLPPTAPIRASAIGCI